jgi:uncharacterized Zn finger protein
VTATCARCAEERAFEVVARGDRLRMACTVCGLELPARLGPAAHWRDLVEGPPAAPVEG